MNKTILKVMTCGNVDDGKSTLLGRLLFETDNLKIDEIDYLEISKKKNIDYSLMFDGLLDEKSSCIPVGHLLKTDGVSLHNYLFDPDINCEERITIYSTREDDIRRDLERPDLRYPPLFNIPGSKFIDKPHQFGGNKLSGSGFGIIKMTKPSGTKAIDAISKWEKNILKGMMLYLKKMYIF